MNYLLLLANAPDAMDFGDGSERVDDDGVFNDWLAFNRALHAAGVLVGGNALTAASSATSVRVRDGRRILSDGPFADTKEHLLGYYVIEVPDLDAALDWAARVPNVRSGTVEVRPMVPGMDPETMLGLRAATR